MIIVENHEDMRVCAKKIKKQIHGEDWRLIWINRETRRKEKLIIQKEIVNHCSQYSYLCIMITNLF